MARHQLCIIIILSRLGQDCRDEPIQGSSSIFQRILHMFQIWLIVIVVAWDSMDIRTSRMH